MGREEVMDPAIHGCNTLNLAPSTSKNPVSHTSLPSSYIEQLSVSGLLSKPGQAPSSNFRNSTLGISGTSIAQSFRNNTPADALAAYQIFSDSTQLQKGTGASGQTSQSNNHTTLAFDLFLAQAKLHGIQVHSYNSLEILSQHHITHYTPFMKSIPYPVPLDLFEAFNYRERANGIQISNQSPPNAERPLDIRQLAVGNLVYLLPKNEFLEPINFNPENLPVPLDEDEAFGSIKCTKPHNENGNEREKECLARDREIRDGAYNHPFVVIEIKQREASNVFGDLVCTIVPVCPS